MPDRNVIGELEKGIHMDRDELVHRLEEGIRHYQCQGREQKAEGIQYALATIFEMEDEQTGT